MSERVPPGLGWGSDVSYRTPGIRTVVAISFAALLTLMGALTSFAVGERGSDRIRQATGKSLAEAAGQAAARLDQDMSARMELVLVLSRLKAMRDPAEAQRAIDELKKSDPTLAWAGTTDMGGVVTAGTDLVLVGADISERPVHAQGIKGPFVGDVHDARRLAALLPNPTGETMKFVDLAAPIRDSRGTVYGSLAMHYSWQWARKVTEEMTRALPGMESVDLIVVSKDDTILVGPKDDIGKPITSMVVSLPPSGDGWGVSKWKDGITYVSGEAHGRASGNASGLGWIVIARQPVTVADVDAMSLRTEIMEWDLFLTLMFSGVGYIAAGWVTGPIRRMAEAADDMRRGIPGADIPLSDGSREMKELSSAIRDMVKSVTSHRIALAAAKNQADMDELTGLSNRRAFEAQLSALETDGVERPVGLCCMDIDDFKSVNDTYGHPAGDVVLKEVARRISGSLRPGDVAARIGGDEFSMLIDVDADGEGIQAVTARILASMTSVFELDGDRFINVGCSIGSALWEPAREKKGAAVEKADRALYEAKRRGKNNAVMHSDAEQMREQPEPGNA